jgi:transposase-like protein
MEVNMNRERPSVLRYSFAFKQKVISEIESGKYSLPEARRIYGIGGSYTIQRWLKRYGKDNLLCKVVRVEMRGEKDRIKALEKRERELEKALADAHLKLIAMETLIENAKTHYNLDLKKNFGSKVLDKSGSKPKD